MHRESWHTTVHSACSIIAVITHSVCLLPYFKLHLESFLDFDTLYLKVCHRYFENKSERSFLFDWDFIFIGCFRWMRVIWDYASGNIVDEGGCVSNMGFSSYFTSNNATGNTVEYVHCCGNIDRWEYAWIFVGKYCRVKDVLRKLPEHCS